MQKHHEYGTILPILKKKILRTGEKVFSFRRSAKNDEDIIAENKRDKRFGKASDEDLSLGWGGIPSSPSPVKSPDVMMMHRLKKEADHIILRSRFEKQNEQKSVKYRYLIEASIGYGFEVTVYQSSSMSCLYCVWDVYDAANPRNSHSSDSAFVFDIKRFSGIADNWKAYCVYEAPSVT